MSEEVDIQTVSRQMGTCIGLLQSLNLDFTVAP